LIGFYDGVKGLEAEGQEQPGPFALIGLGGIKYRKSTIRNQSLFQFFFLKRWAPKGFKWITNMFKKGWMFSNQSIK
jgi:hypothetical protein